MKKNAIQWFITIKILVLSFLGSNAQEQMNILFIAVDDLKPNLACYGDTIALTPNIDALAAEGMVFSRSYCQQAVCAPSRASLMTSRYPDQTGVLDLQTMMREVSPDITSLPEYLITKGFETSATGKIFDFRSVDSELDAPSWSTPYRKHYSAVYYDPVNGKPSYYYASQESKDTIAKLTAEANLLGVDVRSHVRAHYWPAVESADVRYDGYVDGAIANVGIELLEEMAGQSKPFFLGIGFHRPHLPFVAPQEFWDMYERSDFRLAPFRETAANSPSLAYHTYNELRSYTPIPASGDVADSLQLELIHGYYAATSYVDFLVGMVLERLDQLGLKDNTIVVLWGDHGWHLGDHNLWCKHSNFEQATRSPLIIHYPGQANPGADCGAPVEFTDIAPTLCELTGTEIPLYFEGESLVPLFENPDTAIRYGALSQYPRNGNMGYTLRTEQYRYTKWIDDDTFQTVATELYDYENDPLETISLINEPSLQSLISEMDSILTGRISNPSTQERIVFEIYGITSSGDTVVIEDAETTFLGSTQVTGPSGMSLYTHLPGSYDYSVLAPGYMAHSGQIEVAGDTSHVVYLSKERYNVEFEIIQEWNGQAIEGAQVALGTDTLSSNEEGIVFFTDIESGLYDVVVSFLSDQEQQFTGLQIYNDTTIQLMLQQPVFRIALTVLDGYSRNNIKDAQISFNQVTKNSNSDGYAEFEEIAGSFELRVEKIYYHPFSDEIQFSKDTSLTVDLLQSHSDVKIWIKHDESPLNNAVVSIDTIEIITGGLGLARFDKLQTGLDYSFNISREGYDDYSSSFYLLHDTTFTINLEITSLSMQAAGNALSIYPVPADDVIYIESGPLERDGYYRILGVEGKVLLEGSIKKSPVITLDIHDLPAGVYHVNLISPQGLSRNSFLKK